MADLPVSITLSARDDASAAIDKVREALGSVGNTATETGKKADETTSAFERIKAGFETGLGIGLGIAGFHELRDVLDATVETVIGFNAELETMATRLENLTGSVGATTEALQAVREQAEASPFEFKDIEAGEERLLRFNFSIDESSKLLKVAADAAAGGAGSVDLITEAFGRMNTKEELTSRGLMSLTAAGIPVFDMLAQGLNVSTAQAEDLVKKGLIPAKEGIDILSAAIEAKFPDMAAKVAEGFDATVKNLKETVAFAAAEMGKPLFDVLESAIKDALAFLKSTDVQGALQDFSHNVADTVRDVIDWFRQLGTAMSQRDVQENLHEAWESLTSIGQALLDLIKAFLPELATFNTSIATVSGSSTTLSGTVKELSADLRDLTSQVKEVIGHANEVADGLNAVKDAGDSVATMLHNALIEGLQWALIPLRALLDNLNELSTITDKVFHIKIDIPGQAGLQQFFDSIHTVQTVTGGTEASSAGGPGGIPNASAMNAGGGIEGAGPIIPADVGGRAAFQASFAPYAAYAAAQLGIDPSIVTAMAISESGGGNLPGNSFFGMKGSPLANGSTNQATWELVNGQRVNQNAGFATFADAKTSVDAWVQFIQKNDPGAIGAQSPEAFAQGLKSGGYMTDTAGHYAATLRGLGAVDGSAPYQGANSFIGPDGTVNMTRAKPDATTTAASTADMAAKLVADQVDSFDKLIRDTTAGMGKIDRKESISLGAATAQYGPGGTALTTAESDAASKSVALDRNKAIADDIAQRKAAVAQEIADDTEANNKKVAAQELIYNRGLQDEATAHSRQLEDAQIVVNQQLANVELVHQRTLQDAEVVHQQQLTQAATEHQRALQDQQALVSAQLAAADLVHQRSVQDAQVAPNEQLQAQATLHSRTLQDAEVQYQYQRDLGKATTDAQRKQIETAHQDQLENIAHQRQLDDAEAVYQQGVRAAAVVEQRKLQDDELKYQHDQQAEQVVQQRKDADTEAAYQRGLAATELTYQRGLQDTEVTYQRGVAAEALLRRRADEDAATSYARGLEDKAAAHSAELAAAAAEFAKQEKAKQDALDKTLADEAFAREKQQVLDDLAAKKANIAEEYATRTASIVTAAAAERATFKETQDQRAQDAIAAVVKALDGMNGAGDPIIAAMKAKWADEDAAMATSTQDIVGNQLQQQTAQSATAAVASTAAATIKTATSATSTAYQLSAVDISKSLGITDTAIETYADQTKTTWDEARDTLNAMVTTYGVASEQISAAFGITDRAVEQYAIDHHTNWEKARGDLNAAAVQAVTVLGTGGTIPTAAGAAKQAFIDTGKEASKIPSALDQLKAAAQELATQGLDPATKAAQDLQTAIQEIHDKTVTVTTNFVSNGGPSDAHGNGPAGGGSIAGGATYGGLPVGGNTGGDGGSGGGGGTGTIGTPGNPSGTPTHPGSSGPGGIYNDPATGHPYDTGGWLPTGLSLAFNGTGRPERVLGPGESNSIDYDKLAEAMVKAMNKNGSFAVGVDQVHSALLQKARRSGSLQLT